MQAGGWFEKLFPTSTLLQKQIWPPSSTQMDWFHKTSLVLCIKEYNVCTLRHHNPLWLRWHVDSMCTPNLLMLSVLSEQALHTFKLSVYRLMCEWGQGNMHTVLTPSATQIIHFCHCSEHVTPFLKSLHWLLVYSWILCEFLYLFTLINCHILSCDLWASISTNHPKISTLSTQDGATDAGAKGVYRQ